MHARNWKRLSIVSATLLCVVGLTPLRAESAKPPRPWKGTVVGQGEFSDVILDEDGMPVGRIDKDTAVGRSTHLGKFTISPENSFHSLFFGDLSFEGIGVWTAANGDELHVTYEGFGVPNLDPETMEEFPIAATAYFTAVGGTGRFSDASGEMTALGVFTAPPPENPTQTIKYMFEFDGELSY